MEKIIRIVPQKAIEYSFYLLFFLVPLILTPLNYELFEYNKMMLTYGLTVIIVGAWLIKIISRKSLAFRRTPLDFPLLLFFTSQVASTIFSIDRHVSIWGYYSRFNGGLLSTISYLLLYWAFVNNFPAEKIKKLLKFTLVSAIFVSSWAILEHLGIDKNWWVQDVQNRVFSTLGQPNWLAAYLAVLILITIGIMLDKFSIFNSQFSIKSKNKNSKFQIPNYIGLLGYWVIGLLFYATILFTKSRSGFIGFWLPLLLFSAVAPLKIEPARLKFLPFVICSLLLATFLFGAPFEQINKFTYPEITATHQPASTRGESTRGGSSGDSVIDVGITESGTIRQIVWSGAIDIFRHFPLFGTGVETFAFSYYQFRPVAHNMTSEWDFLYNKAHNEYLNYAANTGILGLGSYLLVIAVFVIWNLKNSSKYTDYLLPALFTGWLSILITNFFGFSIVIIQLFFFLIPAISFVYTNEIDNSQQITANKKNTFSQYVFIFGTLLVICYLLSVICRLWYADVVFADGYHQVRANNITSGYETLKHALEINDSEPFYYDEFSFPAAQLAIAFADEKEATLSGILTNEALIASNYAIDTSPRNVNFWKTRTRVFYALSQLDEKYFQDALTSLEQAKKLAPTDPKISYNLGLLYDRVDRENEAIAQLEETTKLKPDYRDAFFALAYLYEKDNKRQKAKEALQYILAKIATNDAGAKQKLEELR